VFPVVGAASDWDERAKRFSHAVAGRVHELIRSSTICGISWGITLYNIIKSIKFIASPGDPPVTFVGVCGESTRRQQSPHLSASYLAAEFDSAFNRPPGHAVGQGATPCSIPAAFSKNERFVISKFINNFTGWGDFRSRVRSMDMVLTSCGATAVKPDLLIEDWLLAQNLTSEELGRLAVGDVAGVLLPTEGNEADVAAINAHWLGLGQDDLADIARRASRTGASRASVPKPGVVLVATGENKADVALSAVRLGLVNKLIIDDELANKLAKLVGIPAGRD
jgi:DNA-binding transcriptional regulator LsrR (DeoR family)